MLGFLARAQTRLFQKVGFVAALNERNLSTPTMEKLMSEYVKYITNDRGTPKRVSHRSMSAYISVELQRQIRKAVANCCAYCPTAELLTATTFEFEHIIPRSAGGETIFDRN